MATTKRKKTIAKKTAAKKKKKAKVYIPANSMISLCAIVVGLCTALLLVNTVGSKKSQGAESRAKPRIEKVVEAPNKAEPQKSAAQKRSTSETSSPETRSPVAKAPQKPAQKADKPQKAADGSGTSAAASAKAKNAAGGAKAQDSSIKKPEVAKPAAPAEKKSEEPSRRPDLTPAPAAQAPAQTAPKAESAAKPALSDIPSIPAAVNYARLVIIFDDGGHNMSQLEKCVTLPFPVTVAVLPRLPHSREAASRVRASGNEVILHQPMQSVNAGVNPGEGAIKPGMTEEQIRSILFANINEIAPITGMNNHEGSAVTADAVLMSYVMKIASDEGIYFLDSRTNVATKVPDVSQALGYSYYERNIFLDNKKNRSDIIAEVMKGIAIANKKGTAIMIGHVWSADILPGILKELYPLLKEKGYVFTTVSNSGALITP
mgnify:CR=1 FL=1